MAEYCANHNNTKERINKMLKKSEVILNAGKEPPLTEEEWFCQLSTEEKAEVIFDIVDFCLNYETYHDKNKYKDLMGPVEDIAKWLKQPHMTQTPQKQDDCPCNVKGCSLETRQACCGCLDYFKWKGRRER